MQLREIEQMNRPHIRAAVRRQLDEAIQEATPTLDDLFLTDMTDTLVDYGMTYTVSHRIPFRSMLTDGRERGRGILFLTVVIDNMSAVEVDYDQVAGEAEVRLTRNLSEDVMGAIGLFAVSDVVDARTGQAVSEAVRSDIERAMQHYSSRIDLFRPFDVPGAGEVVLDEAAVRQLFLTADVTFTVPMADE